jgi:hypothetical protein
MMDYAISLSEFWLYSDRDNSFTRKNKMMMIIRIVLGSGVVVDWE